MAHSFSHSRLARRLSLVGALALAAGIVIAPATRADDRLDIRTLELSINGGDPVPPDLANRTPPLR